MKACGKLLIVEPEGVDNTTKGGIIINKEAPPVGVVVGGGQLDGAPSIGRRVLYRKYAGTEVTVNGERRVILALDDILATLDEGEEVS